MHDFYILNSGIDMRNYEHKSETSIVRPRFRKGHRTGSGKLHDIVRGRGRSGLCYNKGFKLRVATRDKNTLAKLVARPPSTSISKLN